MDNKLDPLSKDFFVQLRKKYSDIIIEGKRSSEEVLEKLSKEYGLVAAEKDIYENDYMYARNMEVAKQFCKNSDFTSYYLLRNNSTEQYYNYYLSRFVGDLHVYIYHDVNEDKLFSNCDLLEMYLKYLKGIDIHEVKTLSHEYAHYLSAIYMYDIMKSET